jgi:hypothetical protein
LLPTIPQFKYASRPSDETGMKRRALNVSFELGDSVIECQAANLGEEFFKELAAEGRINVADVDRAQILIDHLETIVNCLVPVKSEGKHRINTGELSD